MKLQPLIHSRTAVAIAFGTMFAAGLVTFRAQADEWDKRTILTVNQPIQVRDTYLEPGQYVFKLLESQSNRHIVQIFNSDQSHIINTVLAIPKERTEATGHSEFTFYETPPGTARAMRAWFYPGDLIGQEFPYPKHLRQIAMVSNSTVAMNTETTTNTETTANTQTEQPQTQAMTEEKTEEQPVETAQSTPPPTPQEQTPAPTTTPSENNEANRSSELPKTASPYPLIGLSGLVLLGLSGVLRFKRAS